MDVREPERERPDFPLPARHRIMRQTVQVHYQGIERYIARDAAHDVRAAVGTVAAESLPQIRAQEELVVRHAVDRVRRNDGPSRAGSATARVDTTCLETDHGARVQGILRNLQIRRSRGVPQRCVSSEPV